MTDTVSVQCDWVDRFRTSTSYLPPTVENIHVHVEIAEKRR